MKNEMLTRQIIGIYYQVYNELGFGFLERNYQNAFYIALKQSGLKVEAQVKIQVWFRQIVVGNYFADLVVEDFVIIEIKAHECLLPKHENQLLNYLRATEKEVGLLMNFGKKPEFRRKVYDNHLKSISKKSPEKIRVCAASVKSVSHKIPKSVSR